MMLKDKQTALEHTAQRRPPAPFPFCALESRDKRKCHKFTGNRSDGNRKKKTVIFEKKIIMRVITK